ncbi:MAG TPA: hypothetical protein VK021_07265 [Flavobacteriaceae bacterium]|nr:hypothetical protein [Flavobacteriaceae bacterium]
MAAIKLCATCGTQYPKNTEVEICEICAEERQYVPLQGQIWTSPDALLRTHQTRVQKVRENLYEIRIEPKFAIGQRAFLVISENGNFLWDCIPLLDENVQHFINSKGGLRGIGISHPHYYSNMNDWANTFECPIFIHKKDEEYIVDKSQQIELWSGKEKPLWDDLRLINLGGHFDGGSVLMIQNMTEKGVMLCGDILQISLSQKFIAMMYSYPNNIPLPLSEVARIRGQLKELSFNKLYGAFPHQNLEENVQAILKSSLDRYFA